jgi:type I restriction enzyme M protein
MLFLKRLSDQFEKNISQITEELVKEGIPQAKAKKEIGSLYILIFLALE